MNEKLQTKLKTLPDDPGVYLMHNAQGDVIYVGKAKNLKNRVRQYFQSNKNHTPKVRAMVENVDIFEYIVTDSELEALMLECNLIKKYMPKYNILMKDDKHYPFIKIDVRSPYPKMQMTRKMELDGARYFGPYLNANVARDSIDILRKLFGLYSCNRQFPRDCGRGRPCLYYHMKQCVGVCSGTITPEEYHTVVEQAFDFLVGKHQRLLSIFEQEMKDASDKMEYERAANYRDKIRSIEKISQRQKMLGDLKKEQDFIAFARDGDEACVQVFFVRSGKVSGRENYMMRNTSSESIKDILQQFIKQFYSQSELVPREIILQERIDDLEIIQDWLSAMRGTRVSLQVPQRGEKKQLLQMAIANAQQALEGINATKNKARAMLLELKELLNLPALPHRIEAYDISNTGGADSVGSLVVFHDGRPKKSEFRKFKIKTVDGPDDYSSMREVVYRRLAHAQKEQEEIQNGILPVEKAKFLPMPDLILLDGGKGHVGVIRELLEEMHISIPVFGMAKDDRHRTKSLTTDKDIIDLNMQKRVFRFLAEVQEEVHKQAVGYHSKLHKKKQLLSELEHIKGVGPAKRKALLQHFKSASAVKRATVEELQAVCGITEALATEIYQTFHR